MLVVSVSDGFLSLGLGLIVRIPTSGDSEFKKPYVERSSTELLVHELVGNIIPVAP